MKGGQRARLLGAKLSALELELTKPPLVLVMPPAMAEKTLPLPSSAPFPALRLWNPSHDAERDVRLPRTKELQSMRRQLKGLQSELQASGQSAESDVFPGVRHHIEELERMEQCMMTDFVPQHGSEQLISPQSFFTSRLFNIKNRNASREMHLKFTLGPESPSSVQYVGPELRQGDGLVFMAMLNVCRDYRVGKQASFDVGQMTAALWGSYNGQARARLKKIIQRLLRATMEFEGFTVQLVQRFEHPKHGPWIVSLDKDIVSLFKNERLVWLDLSLRRRITEGLATWLYGYIRSQTFLIPWAIDKLRVSCGSDASSKTFREILHQSLDELANEGVIDVGWFFRAERVHWRKPRLESESARPPAANAAPPEKPKQVAIGETAELDW